MDDDLDDPHVVIQRIVQGTIASGRIAVERARQTGTPLVVWRDGRVQEIWPDDPSLTEAKSGK